MIYLFTGANGSGKTCNLLAKLTTEKQFRDRPVYYFNIHGVDVRQCEKLTYSPWRELDEDGVKNWQSLPQGSILVIDEAHKVAPSRQAKIDKPKWIVEFDEHRREGLDILIATQHPKKIDVELRRLVSEHYHFVRTAFNCTRFLFPQCADDCDDPARRRGLEGTKSKVQLPKHVFDLYQSAEIHTHKYEVPRRVKIAIACTFLGLATIAYAVHSFSSTYISPDSDVSITPPELDPFASSSTFNPSNKGKDAVHPSDPSAFRPTKLNDFRSAPAYNELNEVASIPEPQCVHLPDRNQCRCYTGEGVRLQMIGFDECYSYVQYGFYDYTKET